MGGFCGYLATVSGLAAGADAAYIFEEKLTIKDLQRDSENMGQKMDDGVPRGLLLRSEKANENYSTDFIHRLFAEEADGMFSVRANILGHWQQGGTPSPVDRTMGCKMAAKATNWMIEQVAKNLANDGTVDASTNESACLLCIQQRNYEFVTLKSLLAEADFK